MAASSEWTEWHLTPRGWVRGSDQRDFAGVTTSRLLPRWRRSSGPALDRYELIAARRRGLTAGCNWAVRPFDDGNVHELGIARRSSLPRARTKPCARRALR